MYHLLVVLKLKVLMLTQCPAVVAHSNAEGQKLSLGQAVPGDCLCDMRFWEVFDVQIVFL